MKLGLFVKIALYSLATTSYGWRPKGHEWHPPLPGDSRSPCPGLNVMANHGWLPRSGKNIDLATLRVAVTGAYNYAPTTFDKAFEQAIAFNLTTTGNSSTFNLADLAKHDDIEFDGSLSRNDFYFGDDLHFDPVIWATVAEKLGLYEHGDSEKDKYVTVETAAKARAARVRDAMKVNPTFNASLNEISGSPGTTALYLTTLWDTKADAAPKAWIRAFFEQERIPFLEGYELPEKQKTGADINAMFARVQSVNVSVQH
ncbi:Chloroperoxidase [Talaromyces proteolyticus]|uniref:Chloroperoxidase n=1 Tax=Talaromyces proteolyticus TaxID=1131652 RepID=A0AAD4Q3Z8_9EURO|nr:Chloroperoxidase [Talaromyces proteolyticus]KAH8702338.1 Chloroperoxidase [Talaromyces proteolyticus]